MRAAQASASTVPASIDAIGWGWRHSGRRAWAVRGLDLRVEAGQRLLLLGASGAGKSTVLAGLAGVLGADDDGEREGSLLVDGREAAASIGRSGLVLQDPDSQVILARVGDDVAFGCENLGVPRDEIWRRVGEALELVGLRMPLNTPTSRLSGGQKQRLAIAGVLAMHPGLLLLDEPTANLDPEGVAEVRHAIGRTLDATGSTCVIVEHRVDVWRDLVDRVVVIGPQGVIVDGVPDRVLESHASELADLGIWVPGHRMPRPSRSHPMPDRLLTTTELAVGYGTRTVAHGAELTVAAGELLAIVGPNGSGKSTLGMALAGLSRPVAGLVIASEKLAAGIRPDPSAWKSRELLTRIGTVFQVPDHQFLGSTVRADLEIGPRALGLPVAEITARVESLLERLRLSHLVAANPFTLSGGEKRRLSVACVLAARPALLVLDEPTFGQDLLTWNELVLMLVELLEEGIGMVAMTHDVPFVDALADARLDLGLDGLVARVSA